VSTKSFAESSDQMMKLMAYADGELEGAERDEVERLLEKDADAKAFVSQLGGLGVYIRVGHKRRAKTYPQIDLADAIMAKVETITPEPKKEAKAVAKVSSLDAAREKRASRMKTGAVVAAALALAASIFLMTRQPNEAPMAQSPNKTVAPTPNAPVVAAHAAIEVNAVESSGQSVSVFYLPSAKDELSTDVVVWVEESGENK
jgi:hypothetical protein